MYIFEEYLLSLSYFYRFNLKILILALQLNVGERAVLPPPPFTLRSDCCTLSCCFFITTDIIDAQ